MVEGAGVAEPSLALGKHGEDPDRLMPPTLFSWAMRAYPPSAMAWITWRQPSVRRRGAQPRASHARNSASDRGITVPQFF
jgi:hypothetical protein